MLTFVLVLAGSQPIGAACTTADDCAGGAPCVDQVCCDSACNGADPTRCTACSVATGATADGACTIVGGHVCRPAAGSCDLPETCDGVRAICPYDEAKEEGLPCPGGLCFETVCIAIAADAGTEPPRNDDSCDAGGGGSLVAVALISLWAAARPRASRRRRAA